MLRAIGGLATTVEPPAFSRPGRSSAPPSVAADSSPLVTLVCAASVVMLAVCAVMLAFPATTPMARDWLMSEQGPVEIGTFAAFFCAAFVAARLAWSARPRFGEDRVVMVYACVAAFCLFCALEEISWGQSFFDFPTPDAWWHINVQGETNLHDLPGLIDLGSAFVFLFGLMGLGAIALGAKEKWHRYAAPLSLMPLFLLVTAMGAIETLNDFTHLMPHPAMNISALSEAVELIGATCAFAYASLAARSIRAEWAAYDRTVMARMQLAPARELVAPVVEEQRAA
jgi:hypothetical protein